MYFLVTVFLYESQGQKGYSYPAKTKNVRSKKIFGKGSKKFFYIFWWKP
jgi:hypothetical protein